MTPYEIKLAFNTHKAAFTDMKRQLASLAACIGDLQAAGLDIALQAECAGTGMRGENLNIVHLAGTLRLGVFDFPVSMEISGMHIVLRYDFSPDHVNNRKISTQGEWLYLNGDPENIDKLQALLIKTYAALETLREDENAPLFEQLADRRNGSARKNLLKTPRK